MSTKEQLYYKLQKKIRASEEVVRNNYYKIEKLINENKWVLKELQEEIMPLLKLKKYSPAERILDDNIRQTFEHNTTIARESTQRQSWSYSTIVRLMENVLEMVLLEE